MQQRKGEKGKGNGCLHEGNIETGRRKQGKTTRQAVHTEGKSAGHVRGEM